MHISIWASLIMMALLLIVVVGFTKFSTKISRGKIGRNKTSWVVRGYFISLFIAVGAYFFIVIYNDLGQANFDEITDNQAEYPIYYDFGDIIKRGELDTTEGIIKDKDWTFDMQTDRLVIHLSASHTIFVERVPNLEQTVEVSNYKTRSQMMGIDITDRILAPNVEFIKDTLLIEQRQNRIEGAGFTGSFVDSQFTNKQAGEFGGSMSMHMHRGQQVVYIRVPESITLEDPSGMVVIIGEN